MNTGDLDDTQSVHASKAVTEQAVGAFSSLKLFPSGSIVIALYGATIGRLGILSETATVNQACCVMKTGPELFATFLFYSLMSFRDRIVTLASGGGQPNISQEIIRQLRIPVPPLPEQRAIAGFLDRETAKIDALVEEQRRLIALLKEKRQAVISHAVTKGLDPAAPMKPSGIDLLGDIPAHWELKRIKHLVISEQGIQIGPFGGMLKNLPQDETGFKLYGQENTISGDFSKGARWIESERFDELGSYALSAGDLVLTRKGSIGNCQIFPMGALPGIADSDTIRVRIEGQIADPEYVQICLQEADFISTQLQLTKRGAILSGLNSSVVANLVFPLPTLDEQAQLLRFLNREGAKFDTLTAEATRAIILLQERRSALISAAVTGKIDVRNTMTDDTEAA